MENYHRTILSADRSGRMVLIMKDFYRQNKFTDINAPLQSAESLWNSQKIGKINFTKHVEITKLLKKSRHRINELVFEMEDLCTVGDGE